MEKYNPNPINYGIIPKQWLNTPVMSSEEAFMELEKLQNAELANEINTVQAEKATRANEAEKELAKEFEAKMEAKRQAGEDAVVSSDDALNMVRANQMKYGQGRELADDELRRLQIQSLDEERKRRAQEDIIRSTSPYANLEAIDPNTLEVKLLRAGKEKPEGKKGKAEWFIDPNTGRAEKAEDSTEASMLEARGLISVGQANAEKVGLDLQMQRRFSDKLSQGNKVELNPTGGTNKEPPPLAPPLDFKAPPGSKVLQKGDEVMVIYPDGKKKTIDLKTNKIRDN